MLFSFPKKHLIMGNVTKFGSKEKTYVLPILVKYVYVIVNFDLWTPKRRAHDVFALVVNFFGVD